MKIAVFSDIHDSISNLEKAIKKIENIAEAIFFCGDFCSPFSAEILSSANLSTYCVLGNNDEDLIGMLKRSGDKFQ
jgi:uncharacterized protein